MRNYIIVRCVKDVVFVVILLGIFLVRMRENARKMRTRMSTNIDTFYAKAEKAFQVQYLIFSSLFFSNSL